MKKDIEDLIRKSEPKVPRELKPENINLKSKNRFKILRCALPVAVCVALIIGATLLPKKGMNILPKETTIDTSKETNQKDTTKPQNAEKEPGSVYRRVYKTMSNYGSNFYNRGVYYEVDDMVVYDTGSMAINSAESSVIKESNPGASSDYSKTNTREENVDESALVKTDGQYIYVLDERNDSLIIYSAKDGVTEKISETKVDDGACAMYILNGKLIIAGNVIDTDEKGNPIYYSYGSTESKSFVHIYDISDTKAVKLASSNTVDGYYYSSRVSGDTLLLFTHCYKCRYTYYCDEIKEEDYESYIPVVNGEVVAEEDIIFTPGLTVPEFTMVMSVDTSDGRVIESKAILGEGDLYVTGKNIYLFAEYYRESFMADVVENLFNIDISVNVNREKLEIMKISYDESGHLSQEKTTTCKGYLKDDYSADEYNGYLRMVVNYYDAEYEVYSGLYVFDEDLNMVGRIEDIAKGETIRSARFMGDTAYFVTFKNMDPLFSVDLSDPTTPTILGELKIPGFSAYLHPLDENHLIGIGEEFDDKLDFKGVKVSIYDVSDKTNVSEEYKMVFKDIYYASPLYDPNNFLIDTKRQFVGFAIDMYHSENELASYYTTGYIILSYGENGIEQKLINEIDSAKTHITGVSYGLYIDDYIYIVPIGGDIVSIKISEM